MQHLIDGVLDAVAKASWHAALALAITLPDICCALETGKSSGLQYAAWFDKYLGPAYTRNGHTFLTGADAYALRCAFLHEGQLDIDGQRMRKVINSFIFSTAPHSGFVMHMNSVASGGLTKLQLQVDRYAKDILDGVDQWLADYREDAEVQGRIAMQLPIQIGMQPF